MMAPFPGQRANGALTGFTECERVFPECRLRQYRKDFAPALRPIAGLDHAVLVDRDPPRPVSFSRREDAGRRRLSFGNALADRGVPSTCGPCLCGFRSRRRHQEGGERKRRREHSETRVFNAHVYLPFKCYGRLEILARGLRDSASTRVPPRARPLCGSATFRTTKPQQKTATTASKIVASSPPAGLAGLSCQKRGAGLVQINTALQHRRYRASKP